MRWIVLSSVLLIFMASFVSADIEITKQPLDVYNFGDIIETTIKLTTTSGIYGFLDISLICDNYENRLPKEEVNLAANKEFSIDKQVFLINKFAKGASGNCDIRAFLEDDPQNIIHSSKFVISNSLKVDSKPDKSEFKPGDNVVINGKVTKENGKEVNGFFNLTAFFGDGKNSNFNGQVTNGDFSAKVTLPKDFSAGKHLIKIDFYELDPLGEKTNTGVSNYDINVIQVPTSLEIVFDNTEVEPGTNLKVKGILHDQTGEKINSRVILTLKDGKDKILEQVDKNTDEFLEYPVPYNEPPSTWHVLGVSQKITGDSSFRVLEKADVDVQIINSTLMVKNMGNVPYDKILTVNIGSDSIEINPELGVDETKKYSINAPDGNYQLEVLANDESKITGNVALTGKSVSVKEQSGFDFLVRYPLSWIFLIAILGFVSYLLYRDGIKKTFFGKMSSLNKEIKMPVLGGKKESEAIYDENKNTAQMSISMSGDKQSSTIVCLKVKNERELGKKIESTDETIGKIKNLAEEKGAYVYGTHDSIFFIWAPVATKTFNNEMNAIETAEEIANALNAHNRLFKQKIEFGISVNNGDIVAKKEKENLKFMGLGNFINQSKKIASASNSEVYLDKKVRGKVMSSIKTEKVREGDIDAYSIKEIKKDQDEHKKFISSFIKRLEKEKEEKKKD